jgi:ubiquinone/menaquinone biosynthesis C-methylase UbiE
VTRSPPWPERLQALRYDVDAAAAYAPAYAHIARALALERGAFLDVGCGPGWLAIAVAAGRPDLDAVGIDRSAAMLRVAERNKGFRLNVTFREMAASRIVYPDRTFDAAAVVHAHDVWRDARPVLDELFRVLVPGGRAYVYEPDPDGEIPAAWIRRRGGWPPDALLRRTWRRTSLGGAAWESLKQAVQQSPFRGGVEGRHGWYRRLVLEAG